MSMSIAVVGKGGTGKTSISALLIQQLSQKGAVLAIDADPASNLDMALGITVDTTVGRVREDMAKEVKSGKFSPGISKPDFIQLKIQESLVESPGFDLLAMGRPEGPGCYCAANNMLRSAIDRLSANYKYVVVDCEAGMEHVSRQTTRDINVLLIVSDPSLRGVTTAARMKDLIKELRTHVDRIVLVVNRVKGQLSPELDAAIRQAGLDLIMTIPDDPAISALDAAGKPVIELTDSSPLKQSVKEIIRKLNLE